MSFLGSERSSPAATLAMRRGLGLVLAVSMGAGVAASSAQSIDPASLPEPLGVLALPDKPAGAHWVWICSFVDYGHATLVDADSGVVLGTLELGYQGILPQLPRSGDAIYNVGVYFSRGFHGERTEVVEIFDPKTLTKQGEIEIAPKSMRGLPSANLTTLTDDDRFLLQSFFTPALTFGVVDLASKQYVGEIETAGCAHVMAAGSRRFFSLCGDGSLLTVELDDSGNEKARQRHPGFFDAEGDPLHGTGARSGDVWYFASVRGVMHAVDTSGGQIRFLEPWSFQASDDAGIWIPASPSQHLAIHRASGRIFALMAAVPDLEPKPGGYAFHRETGTEVWVFDEQSHERVDRFKLERGYAGAIAVSQDSEPLLYATAFKYADIYDARTGVRSRVLSDGKELSGTQIMMVPVP